MLEKLPKCKALEKMKRGELHAITIENTQELFAILDVSERGELSVEDLRVLKTIQDLELTDDDIDLLIKDCDKDNSGKVNASELHAALQQGSLVYKTVLNELGQGPKVFKATECTRDDLLDFLNDENDTMEALCSMPLTMLAFGLFFFLMSSHLEMELAFNMQSAIQGEVEGEGKPYLGTYVHDVPSFWYWMETSFLSAQFKSTTEKLNQYPYPGRFAAYNQMIGGMQIVKHQTTDILDCEQEAKVRLIYDTIGNGRCHKGGDQNSTSEFFLYHQDSTALYDHVKYLEGINWIDHNTIQLDFTNLYYNANLGMFTDFHLTVDWEGSGFVKILFSMESFLADPYFNSWYIAIDLIYILILAKMFYGELKEMLPRLLNGLDGFIQYWEFWNVVDWLNILIGIIFFTFWGLVVTSVTGELREKIAALPTEQLDNWVITNQTYFTTAELKAELGGSLTAYQDQIAEVHTLAGEIASTHVNLRLITFFYCFTLMLKFFKAFRANPRLNIVILTIQTAAIDIVHFFLVFLIIFVVFSMMAVVIFGSKIRAFRNQDRSFFYCWRILLGDFDVEEMEAVDYLYANLWFLAFQIMVMMILLNMLLAIIMDTYGSVVGDGKDKTIWAQVRDSVNTVRETRGHLSLLYITCEMEDEDQRAHPGMQVTSKSLRKAFERDKMTRANSEYLIRKTSEYKQAKEQQCDLKMSDAIRLIGQTKTMVLKISQDSAKTLEMLVKKEREPMDMRHDAIMAGLDPDDPEVIKQMKNAKGAGVPMLTNGTPWQAGSKAGAPPTTTNQMNGMHGYGASPTNPSMAGMQGMHNASMGMQSMPGTMGVQGSHPFGVQSDMGYEIPFYPGNSQNVLTNGSITNNTQILQITNGPSGQTGGFGTGMSNSMNTANSAGFGMANSTMNTMSQPGYPPNTNSQQQPQQMQSMSMQQGGMGMSNAAMGQMLDKMTQMQQTMAQMCEQIVDQRNYIEQRDSWLETRMSQLDRRCQKVEVLSDRLHTLLKQLNVTDLASVPREVNRALNIHLDNLGGLSPTSDLSPRSPGGIPKALRDLSTSSEAPPSSNEPLAALEESLAEISHEISDLSHHERTEHSHGHHNHGVGMDHKDAHKLEDHMKKIERQLELLASHAEATPQITRLLWRMDLNLRQLTGQATNLSPQAQAAISASAAAHDQADNDRSATSSAQASRRAQYTIGNSRNASRDQSKQRIPSSMPSSAGAGRS